MGCSQSKPRTKLPLGFHVLGEGGSYGQAMLDQLAWLQAPLQGYSSRFQCRDEALGHALVEPGVVAGGEVGDHCRKMYGLLDSVSAHRHACTRQ